MISLMTASIILACSLLLTSSAQLLAKWRLTELFAEPNQQWSQLFWRAVADGYLWLMATMMLFAMAGWYLAMSRLPVGTMIIMASVTTPIIAMGGWVFFGESMTLIKLFGIVLVMIGVMIVGTQLR